MKLDDYEEYKLFEEHCKDEETGETPTLDTGGCLKTVLLVIVVLLLFRLLIGG